MTDAKNKSESRIDAKPYIDSLFSAYEETRALTDFKEELLSNLNAKIAALVKSGKNERDAFDKAIKDLGDISALADEISLKKKQEFLAEAFMDIHHYMTPRHVAGYIAFGATLLFGIVIALVAYLGVGVVGEYDEFFDDSFGAFWAFDAGGGFGGIRWIAALGSCMPFAATAIAGFVFLGVTQELPGLYPVSGKRAFWYALSSGLIVFGLFLFPVVLFGADGYVEENTGLLAAIAAGFLPFIIPGSAILAYLILTEKDRRKPWLRAQFSASAKKASELWSDPITATKFGMYSGAIWMLAIAAFFLAGFFLQDGFKYSWLAFIVAAAVQCIVQGSMIKIEKIEKVGKIETTDKSEKSEKADTADESAKGEGAINE
ncbi:MAG: hypothetical protein Ta2A_22470 [Treponemataceae bacterium]|nr:MAG: hypothetical protein Ta2A_22470 [Treponemataceae bacterium]